MIIDACNLALHIDSSAAYDRRKPSRGFRRWKALPEIKETVLSLQKKRKKKHFKYFYINWLFDTRLSRSFALLFRIRTCKDPCHNMQLIEQLSFKLFLLRFFVCYYVFSNFCSSFAYININFQIQIRRIHYLLVL